MECKINHIISDSELSSSNIDNNYFKIIYITNGTKKITLYNNEINYNNGEILYIRKYCNLSYQNIPENGIYEEIEIIYSSEELHIILNNYANKIKSNKIMDSVPPGHTEPIISQNIDTNLAYFYENLLSLISGNFVSKDQHIEWIKRSEFVLLLISSDLNFISSNMFYDIKVHKNNFIKIVNENIYSKITISELAKMCEMSLSTFKKAFAEYYKQPPHKWIIEQRLNKAKMLLISTNIDVNQTALECCFENTSHFIKLFKKRYRLTPLKFRNNTKNH